VSSVVVEQELLDLINCAKEESWLDLDLSARGLTEIPEAVLNLSELRTLQLRNNQINKIPEVISNLKNLTILGLNNNHIEEIPESLLCLTSLEKLHLRNNRIKNLPSKITNLTNLKLTVLDISGNQITEIPEIFERLPKLRELDLRRNPLPISTKILESSTKSFKNIFDYLSVLKQIELAKCEDWQELNLSEKGITEIPKEIVNLNNLRKLQLNKNQIEEIPEEISELVNLTKLEINSNKIKEIPDTIGNLINLTTLSLSDNQIEEIPEDISKLVKLNYLDLSDNKIKNIPQSFGKLTNLTGLYLSKNKIKNLSETIGKLTNMETLALQDNQIIEIPKTIVNLNNLVSLSFANNKIKVIPIEISRLTNLKQLVLYRNLIVKIPREIGALINLEGIFLNDNQIESLPEEMTCLSNLVALYLYNNKIKYLPKGIGRLTNLKILNLNKNQISEIPETIENLTKLEKLDLRENLLSVSPEVLDSQDIPKIFNYLKQLRNGVSPLHEAKLLLVGEGNVGKTSLIRRLLHNHYKEDERITEGVKVQKWKVRVDNKDINLNVWDFGGQVIYHATHQFFLTKRSLYLLVYNCRASEEENRLEYWLKLIESFGGHSPVIIVGNKKDESPLDINQRSLRVKYPNIKAILQTSCLENEGIDELRDVILKQLIDLKEIYDLLPISWLEVKRQLESMPNDFIAYSRYIGICHEHKIAEEQNQEQLIDLLHRLGVVLNFREHPILQNTNVLNPNWLTQGIYAILSDEILKSQNKGIFTFTDLSERILDPLRYPENRHKYLVELMQQFELCFALDDNPNEFLIPGLLPKDEPKDTNLEGETLEFQYHYRLLPESILSRFIVLNHDKIYMQIYWRSGVMLQYSENNEIYNIACIKADVEDKNIFVTISGRKETRRLFLGIIRSTFQKIHNSFGNLEITEWVPVPNHPDHPPLDYQELLGLESMGENIIIGKLKLKIDLSQLLDGYETLDDRQSYVIEAKYNFDDSCSNVVVVNQNYLADQHFNIESERPDLRDGIIDESSDDSQSIKGIKKFLDNI